MNKYKFIKLPNPDNEFDNTKVEFEVEAEKWTDLVEEFEAFLRGCGFRPKGTLDFTEEE